MQIVKFKNGTYGIRKGIFFYKYKDLVAKKGYWWDRASEFYNSSCQDTKEKVEIIYTNLQDKGEIV